MRRVAAAACAAALVAGTALGHGGEPTPVLSFPLPPAGSYALPPIQPLPDGEVLDTQGRALSLATISRGHITLLGLVYTRCADPAGCPRATWAFSTVRGMLRADPALEQRVRLVTLSFDPAHDDPAAMAAYAAHERGAAKGAPWDFLTTRSRATLRPILDGLGQDLSVARGSRAVPGTEEFTHTLKVYLVDSKGRVREIYSSAWLMPAMIVNDMRTLALEERAGYPYSASTAAPPAK